MNSDSIPVQKHAPSLADDGALLVHLPKLAFLPFLAGAVILAVAYGASFMLPDALREAGIPATAAGTMIGAGTIATLVGSLVAGRMAKRLGLMPPIVLSAVILGLALVCFSSVALAGVWAGYLGGLLLGAGWAIAYILMPIQVIQCLRPTARLEAMMLLSGSLMIGVGLSAPLGHLLAERLGSVSRAFAFDAALCSVAALLLIAATRAFRSVPQQPLQTVALTFGTIKDVLGCKTVIPVVMIGLAACSFSGLANFQSMLARAHGVPPEAFFLTFTATTVTLRLLTAAHIGRLPLPGLAIGLTTSMLIGLFGMSLSGGSLPATIASTIIFSIGYGLNYSTLNALVVNLAAQRSISIPVASQVFTVGYFIGLFGFPLLASRAIALAGPGSLLIVIMCTAALNVCFALSLLLPSSRGSGALASTPTTPPPPPPARR